MRTLADITAQLRSSDLGAIKAAALEITQRPEPEAFDALAQTIVVADVAELGALLSPLEQSTDPRAEDPLWKILAGPDGSVREGNLACAMLLKRRGQRELATRVQKLSIRPDPEGTAWVLGLAALRDARALKLLRKAVKGAVADVQPSWEAVRIAVQAIAEIGGPDATAALIRLLEGPENDLRAMAAEALASRGPAMIDVLVPLLEDDDELVRIEAAWALGKLGDARGLETLAGFAYKYGKPLVKRLITLGADGVRAACEHADLAVDDDVRDWAADAIAAMGESIRPVLVESLESGRETPGHVLAAMALGRMGGEGVFELLTKQAALRAQDAACDDLLDGIRRLGDPRTIQWLIEYADRYPENRHYAIDELEALRAKEAVPAIRRWLTDGPNVGRDAAKRALKALDR